MVAAGNVVGGCKIDVGGVNGDMIVVGAAVAAGFDMAAFFVDFFLFEAAGIVVAAEYRWKWLLFNENRFWEVKTCKTVRKCVLVFENC
jgi:hypothetical protein